MIHQGNLDIDVDIRITSFTKQFPILLQTLTSTIM